MGAVWSGGGLQVMLDGGGRGSYGAIGAARVLNCRLREYLSSATVCIYFIQGVNLIG